MSLVQSAPCYLLLLLTLDTPCMLASQVSDLAPTESLPGVHYHLMLGPVLHLLGSGIEPIILTSGQLHYSNLGNSNL